MQFETLTAIHETSSLQSYMYEKQNQDSNELSVLWTENPVTVCYYNSRFELQFHVRLFPSMLKRKSGYQEGITFV